MLRAECAPSTSSFTGPTQGQAIDRVRTRRMAPLQKPPLPSWVVAAGLAVFVAGTYYSTFRRVGGGDLEKELERELEEEARRQEKSGA